MACCGCVCRDVVVQRGVVWAAACFSDEIWLRCDDVDV